MSTVDHIIKLSSLGLLVIGLAIAIILGQFPIIIGLLLLPFLLLYFFFLFKYPAVGVYSCLFFAFAANGITRYVDIPMGVSMDIFLFLTLAALFIQRFTYRQWGDLKNGILIGIGIWVFYCLLQLLNPEAVSFTAWLYAVRSPAFYPLFALIIGLMFFKQSKELHRFIHAWFIASALAAIYSFKQFYIGLDQGETRWLFDNASTHVLYGNLRVFSFYSDAAQFGAAMAHTTMAAMILALGSSSNIRRILYIFCALLCGYAMALSGTRGAIFLLSAGILSYLILSRNWQVLLVGAVVAFLAFGFLKFTYIGQSNYQIQRMRSAFNLSDPSFQERIKNQKKLTEYLEDRPFGGGIGSAGYWGLRFSPDTFLAKTPLDSWYVKIWAETGIVGIILYLLITFSILLYLAIRIWNTPPSKERQIALALFAGLAGVSIANYGNQVLGQMPTALLFYFSIAIIYTFTSKKSKGHSVKTERLNHTPDSFSLHH